MNLKRDPSYRLACLAAALEAQAERLTIPQDLAARLDELQSELEPFAHYRAVTSLRPTANSAVVVQSNTGRRPARLHTVLSGEEQRRKIAEAAKSLGPPPGFERGKRGCWNEATRRALLDQREALRDAGCTYEGALIELHKAWGYSKRPDKEGGQLADQISKARAERRSRSGQVHRLTRERIG